MFNNIVIKYRKLPLLSFINKHKCNSFVYIYYCIYTFPAKIDSQLFINPRFEKRALSLYFTRFYIIEYINDDIKKTNLFRYKKIIYMIFRFYKGLQILVDTSTYLLLISLFKFRFRLNLFKIIKNGRCFYFISHKY